MRHLRQVMILATLLALVGCERPSSPTAHSPSVAPTNVTTYEVKGVIREIRANGSKALIHHEDIPNYMEAMTMEFEVKDTNELRGLIPGDPIQFRILVTDQDGWIDQVRRAGTNALPPSSAAPVSPPAGWVDDIEPGSLLTDCTLTNQLGQKIRLSDFRGRALAFTFIFTRCPFPVYCPRMNNNLASVQQALAQNGSQTNWHLLSISFDPEFDTPAQLARYAAGYAYDPRHWSFATGATQEIRKLGGIFGLAFAREGKSFSHNVRTVVVDAAGRVQKLFPNNEWKPEELVDEMKRAMAPQP